MTDTGRSNDLVKAFIVERAAQWNAVLADLIRIPSPYEAEHRLIDYVSSRIEGMGFRPIHVHMDRALVEKFADAAPPISDVPGRCNIVVKVPGTGDGRSLIFNSHLDIVPEGEVSTWTHPPFSGDIDAERNVIFGRGAMDDKAGVAICLGLLQTIAERKLKFSGDIVFQFVLEDETTGNGSLACLEAGHVADAAIILDGTREARAINQHAGNVEFNVRQKGLPASVSVSHMGMNAAETLASVVLALRSAVFRLNEGRRDPWTEFPSPYQFVIQALQSGAERLMVPVEASARCYVTFPPPDTLASIKSYLENECARFSQSTGLKIAPKLDWNGFAIEPSMTAANDAFDAIVTSAAYAAGIGDFRFGPSTGTSDMRHFAKRNIPCILYGPGRGYNPHRADEHYYLDDLPKMMGIYLDIAAAWSGLTTRV